MGVIMAYTHEQKIAILNYAKKWGTIAAAEHFGVASSTVVRWNHKLHIYEPQDMREFSDDEKIEMLTYAEQHGLSNAARHYNVALYLLQKWNKQFHRYNQCGRKENVEYEPMRPDTDDEYKLSVLKYAGAHSVAEASKKYGVAESTIRLWNGKLQVFKSRTARKFTPEQRAEIVALAESTDDYPAIARQFDITTDLIRRWQAKQNSHKK